MSENSKGWVSIHRTLLDHWLWKDRPFSKGQAWIDLILLANFEDKKIAYKGEIELCRRGTVNLSILELSKRWGWDRKTVRRFLSVLERDQMVTVSATTHRTTITLEKYDFFQDYGSTDGSTDGSTNGTTKSQQSPTTNKDNNLIIKQDKHIDAKPPTLNEVKTYIAEKGYNVDADTFFNYYAVNDWHDRDGKPVKRWKQKIVVWDRKKRERSMKDSTIDNGSLNLERQNYDQRKDYSTAERIKEYFESGK